MRKVFIPIMLFCTIIANAQEIVYQTLHIDHRGIPQPYLCDDDIAWLGPGCYFWEAFITNAHWWASARKYDKYFICEAEYTHNPETLFDLVGNTTHILKFTQTYELMKRRSLINRTTTVCRVLNLMRGNPKWSCTAIRADGKNSRTYNPLFDTRVNFQEGHIAYLDLTPTIQICFLSLDAPDITGYKEIFCSV